MRPMPIIRSRTGCFTCRRRKKKCNEEKPVCSGCKRNRLDCHWPTDTKSGAPGASGASAASASGTSTSTSVSTTVPSGPQSGTSAIVTPTNTTLELPTHQQKPLPKPRQTSFDIKRDSNASVIPTHPQPQFLASPTVGHVVFDDGSVSSTDGGLIADAEMVEAAEEVVPISPSSSSSSSATSGGLTDAVVSTLSGPTYDQGTLNDLAIITKTGVFPDSDPIRLGITLPMSMLPQHGHDSYELLGYYLSRTANSMGNGSTEVNPFIAKLIPLAFSDPLVLQLILAQSAVHRQASEERLPSDIVAQRYYTDSLRMFRNVVSEYVSGNQTNTLVLTVGSLILCLTEVAKGDIHGTIFDHLTASKSLLQSLLARPKSSEISDDLPEFLVEYYMHMAASSMISIDPQYSSQPLLSPEIEHLARELVERKYVGQLCGCWLELLVLIPQIFHLGHSMLLAVNTQTPPSSDDIITFGFLQSQVMGYFPDPSVGAYSRLAALVFKQGVLLYLWTILGTPHNKPETSAHKNLIDGAVTEAIGLLAQFPATVRINTSLCWPLAVIGCCTSDPIIQNVLRTRLQTMVDTIGLGNMRETLTLLEHVWKQPLEETSPWTLCRSMREHQIWISFA